MKLVKINKIHQGKFLTYYIADYLNNDNKIKSYEFVSRNKNLNENDFGNNKATGVGIIPISLDGNYILLEKEFRLACNQWIYNFPTGLIDENETPVEAAKRELYEETGVELVSVETILPSAYVCNSHTDEKMVTIIAKAKGDIKPSNSFDEEIIAAWYSKEQIKELLKSDSLFSVRTQLFLYNFVKENKNG